LRSSTKNKYQNKKCIDIFVNNPHNFIVKENE